MVLLTVSIAVIVYEPALLRIIFAGIKSETLIHSEYANEILCVVWLYFAPIMTGPTLSREA